MRSVHNARKCERMSDSGWVPVSPQERSPTIRSFRHLRTLNSTHVSIPAHSHLIQDFPAFYTHGMYQYRVRCRYSVPDMIRTTPFEPQTAFNSAIPSG